jgi:hypothetical protein
MLSLRSIGTCILAVIVMWPSTSVAQDLPPPSPAQTIGGAAVTSPAPPPETPERSVRTIVANAIGEAGEGISDKVGSEVEKAGREVRGLAFQLGAMLAAAIAVALVIGMIVGSVLSSFILRSAIRRAVGPR